MKFIASLSSLVALVSAASVDLTKRETPFDLKIELVGNSEVKASLTNKGSEDVKVFKTGSILDDITVEKSRVFSGSDMVDFDGVRLQLDLSALDEDNFQIIGAGETVEVSWDVAEDHDLTSGGDFDIASEGVLPYAEGDSTELAGYATYSSNVIHASVDGEKARKVRRDFHAGLNKRAVVQSDCTGTRRTQTVNALSNCRAQAQAAVTQASSGAAARMTEFFKSSSSSTRSTVAGVFNRIASECGSSTSGASRQYCTDIYPGGACASGVVAYTVPAQSYMVNCPYYFNSFPAQSNSCYGISHASTTLHEVTHLTQVRGTSDYNCYGYNCVRSLSASQNLNHADTYTLFAQSIYARC